MTSLWEIAALFLRLGATAFGGPAAHIAFMRAEVVDRRHWMTDDEFLDLLGATNLIPGPNSTELAIHIGHRRRGAAGLIVAGACFILPATVLVAILAHLYIRYHSVPTFGAAFYGVKPVIVAIVFQAGIVLWRRTVVKGFWEAGAGLAAAALALLGINELALLLALGLLFLLLKAARQHSAREAALCVFVAMPAGAANAAVGFGTLPLFLFFVKVGSVLFGSGYVLLAFLQRDLVEKWHWLTQSQLLDAIAVGQITPGPVSTTATFIGYLLEGPKGAIVATLGMFLPAFLFVAASGPIVPRLRRSALAGAFLNGVNVASLGLMAAVTYRLGRAAVADGYTVALLIISVALLMRYRVNPTWLIGFGAAAGLLISRS